MFYTKSVRPIERSPVCKSDVLGTRNIMAKTFVCVGVCVCKCVFVRMCVYSHIILAYPHEALKFYWPSMVDYQLENLNYH